ncbi:non-ribosomal peptide synthetase [Photobacterium halotolerans]|uniref:non-ribosomal peptide synthetase n=1 Tax=Photobacterium halotolerans TaxID=265726 RepID=UPI00061928CB|nr:non-ribosomal peptide synthetase [Photobacterium halotolerans]
MTDMISFLADLERKGIRLALNEKGQLTSQCSKQALTPEIGQQIRDNKDAIIRCLSARQAYEQPIPVQQAASGPLSFSQSGLWFIEQYEDNSHLYNMPVHFRLTGKLDVGALEYAFSALAQKHASLRTRFIRNSQGKGEQHIAPQTELTVIHHDLSHLDKATREQALLKMVEEDIYRPFDLEQGGLTRVELVKLGEAEHLLMLTQHHIISDGWSVKNMFADFKQAFLAYQNNQQQPVKPTAVNYIDYAHWLNSPAFRDYHEEFRPFWVERLKGIPEVHALPLDKPRPASHNNDGALVFSEISLPKWQQFQRLCQQNSSSYFIGLHAVFSLLMARLGGDNDVVIGTPLAYRERADIEDVVGFFVNTIVLRTQLDEHLSFSDYLRYCREQDLVAFDHQLFRFESLSEAIGADRTTALNPIFQIMLVYQAKVDFNDLIPGCGAVEEPTPVLPAKTDLSLKVTELVDGVRLEWLYSKGVFEHQTVARFAQMFLTLLDGILAAPLDNVMQLPMVDEAHQDRIAQALVNLPARVDAPMLIHEQVSRHAADSPAQPAVTGLDQTLTYQALEQASNRLAHYLLSQHPAGEAQQTDKKIGVVASRTSQYAVAALAAWKAGMSYVPLDPAYPTARLQHLVDDAQLAVVIAPDAQFAESHAALTGCQIINVTDEPILALLAQAPHIPPAVTVSADDLAYVIYTSGSTGLPKGVEVEHGAFVNVLTDHTARLALTPDSVMLNPMSLAFDAGNMTAILPLFAGAKLALGTPDETLLDQAEAHGATHMISSTALFAAMTPRPLSSLSTVGFGGEACPATLAASWQGKLRLLNMYGPTEFTVTALVKELQPGEPVTIGHPVDNTQALILDAHGQLCPVGVAGELCLAGLGLARGYLNQPELTAKVFVTVEVAGQTVRCYRTGDKARWLNHGEVEYLGRMDQQVKLRGYRIELAEIESQIAKVAPQLHQVRVIVAGEGAQRQLVAYATAETSSAASQPPVPGQILSAAARILPEYMVPVELIVLDELPLTVNGKLDISRLPERQMATGDGVQPENDMEAQVLAIWQEVLNTELGVEDDFFRLGGDSILSIQLNTRLRDAGFACTVKDVFEAKTVRKLCRTLAAHAETERAVDAEQGQLSGTFDLHPIQRWFDAQPFARPAHWNQAVVLAIPDLETARLTDIMSRLLAHHDALRLRVTEENGVRRQRYQAAVTVPALAELDAAGMTQAELYDALTALQSQFDLENGPVMAWARIRHLPGEDATTSQTGLFLALHHWVVDAVSWRILADDLQRLSQGLPLAEKTSSYRQWGEALKDYAERHPAQFDYWRSQLEHVNYSALPATRNQDKDGNVIPSQAILQLDQAETDRLVGPANTAFSTEVRDLLLSALSVTIKALGWGDQSTVMLEGHGREEIGAQLDVSRTVGWFTSAYPCTVAVQPSLAETIKQAKENLRRIPDNGVGFNALRSYHPQGEQLTFSPVVLNYLGRQTQKQGQQAELWRPLPVVPGQTASPLNPGAELLSLHGGIYDGQLTLRQVGVLDQALSEAFMAAFKANLLDMIHYCEQHAKSHGRQSTPSDYPLVRLTQPELDGLSKRFAIETLLPASSLQQSMFAHQQRCPDDEAYLLQTPIRYRQPVDLTRYQQAWQAVSAAYPALRTVLSGPHHMGDQLIQVVQRQPVLPFEVVDLTGEADAEALIAEYCQHDRQRGIALDGDALLRVRCFRLAEDDIRVIFSCHHAVIDGWSGPRLFAALHQAYEAMGSHEGDDCSGVLPVDQAYLDHAAYAVRSQSDSAAFWAGKALDHVQADDLTVLFGPDFASSPLQQQPEVVKTVLSAPAQTALQDFARQVGVTHSTVAQFAWHRLVARLTGQPSKNTTIVGNVVPGRDAPVTGIATSVGLYINTLPLVMRWQDGDSLASQLIQLQGEAMALNQHATQSLMALQAGRSRLFDCVFVYENYPRAEANPQARADDARLRPEFGPAFEKVEIPLSLVVNEVGGQLSLRFEFDAMQVAPSRASEVLRLWQVELQQVIAADPQQALPLTPVEGATQILSSQAAKTQSEPDQTHPEPGVMSPEVALLISEVWQQSTSQSVTPEHDAWHQPLCALGIDSLAAIGLVQRLNHALNMHDVSAVGVTQPVTLAFLYQHATPDAMCRALSGDRVQRAGAGQSEREAVDVVE